MDFNLYDLDISDDYKEFIRTHENPVKYLSEIINANQHLKSQSYRKELMGNIEKLFEEGDAWTLADIHRHMTRKGFTGKAKSIENRLYESGIYFYNKFDKKWRNHR